MDWRKLWVMEERKKERNSGFSHLGGHPIMHWTWCCMHTNMIFGKRKLIGKMNRKVLNLACVWVQWILKFWSYLWLYMSEIKERRRLFWFLFVIFCFVLSFNSSSSPLGSWNFVAACLLVAEALWLWEPCFCAWGGVRTSQSNTKPSLLTAACKGQEGPFSNYFFFNVFFWGGVITYSCIS